MDKKDIAMIGFEMVAYSGDARSELLELLKELRLGNFDNIDTHLANADKNINLAHLSQTELLKEEATGNWMDVNFTFVHGQDHLMTTILLRELVDEFIDLYKFKRSVK